MSEQADEPPIPDDTEDPAAPDETPDAELPEGDTTPIDTAQAQEEFVTQAPDEQDPDEGLQNLDTDPDLEEEAGDPTDGMDDDADISPETVFGDTDDEEEDDAAGSLPDFRFTDDDVFADIFPTRLTAFTSATGGLWKELSASGNVLTDFTDGRFCSATSAPVLFGLPETGFVSVQKNDADSARYPSIPSGVVDVYLTQVGGSAPAYTYDGYLDAAKTIKIFAAQASLNGAGMIATRGTARLVGKLWRLVEELGLAALSPLTTIGADSEGSETADTGTWTRGSNAVEVWVISRVVYNDAGDQVLYSYARKFTYDTNGALYSIGAETRITVDVTDDCP